MVAEGFRLQKSSSAAIRMLCCSCFAGFQWKRATETKYPVENKKANVVLPNVVDDTAAAIAGAGGGRGLDQELE